ncbi:MAG TPA: hypothetical protein VMU95_10875 [Trebonia sp.]|nr:hypothetical protein [Trebonia sp.]
MDEGSDFRSDATGDVSSDATSDASPGERDAADGLAGLPEPPPPGHGPWRDGAHEPWDGPRLQPRRRLHPLTLAAVAVAGITIGVAAVMISDFSTSTTAVGGTPSSSPTAQAPPGGNGYTGGGPASLSPLTGNGSGLTMMLSGRVTAVSATSITIGGNGPSVTAKVTQETRFSGQVRSIGGVKVGDQVSATFSGSSASSLTVTAIEDPASPQ